MSYELIYADPPWKYNERKNAATKFGRGTPYPTMTTDDICALDIPAIAADNCALALWATGPRIPDAMRVIDAWGFRYCTILFTWAKISKSGAYRLLPGYYTGSNAEICFLGARGSVPVDDKSVRQIIAAPLERHSKKPAEAYDRLDRLWPDAKRIELFARDARDGWHAWGNELTNNVTIGTVQND